MKARRLLAVIGGFVAWWVAASLISRGIKLGWPAYAAAEPKHQFTLGMMAARLGMGAAATVAAGWVTHRIAPGSRHSALGLGLLLLLFFIPVHVWLFKAFPLWYHLVFLASLVPLSMLSWWLAAQRTGAAVSSG